MDLMDGDTEMDGYQSEDSGPDSDEEVRVTSDTFVSFLTFNGYAVIQG